MFQPKHSTDMLFAFAGIDLHFWWFGAFPLESWDATTLYCKHHIQHEAATTYFCKFIHTLSFNARHTVDFVSVHCHVVFKVLHSDTTRGIHVTW